MHILVCLKLSCHKPAKSDNTNLRFNFLYFNVGKTVNLFDEVNLYFKSLHCLHNSCKAS